MQRKRGARRLPFFNLLCRLGSDANRASVFGRRAPRERCVQLWFSSKPGGVMSPPELYELTSHVYSSDSLNASEELENPQRIRNWKMRRNLARFECTTVYPMRR